MTIFRRWWVKLSLGASSWFLYGDISYLFVFLQLRVEDLPYLGQLGSVVRVLDAAVVGRALGRRSNRRRRRRGRALLRAGHALRQQHVVQPHDLGVWRVVVLDAPDTEHCGWRWRRRQDLS